MDVTGWEILREVETYEDSRDYVRKMKSMII